MYNIPVQGSKNSFLLFPQERTHFLQRAVRFEKIRHLREFLILYADPVSQIQIFHTILNTPDKKTVVIPNGGLSTGALTNFSAEPVRRVEWTFGISYSDNIDKAREIIMEVLTSDERILPDPEPFVGLIKLNESSVDLVTRVWVNSPDFWNVFFSVNERVKNAFDSGGISIPFPQRDVHIIQK